MKHSSMKVLRAADRRTDTYMAALIQVDGVGFNSPEFLLPRATHDLNRCIGLDYVFALAQAAA
jgi:hypothetical protein